MRHSKITSFNCALTTIFVGAGIYCLFAGHPFLGALAATLATSLILTMIPSFIAIGIAIARNDEKEDLEDEMRRLQEEVGDK